MICTSSLALAAPYLGMRGGGLVWVAGPGLLFVAAGLGLGFPIVALARRDLAGMRPDGWTGQARAGDPGRPGPAVWWG